MADENVLIAKAQSGDRESLNTLVERYWQPLYRFIYYKVGHTEDAQELTQETLLKAFRALANYKPTNATFKTYLGRIALNLITDFWRKKGRTPPVIDIAEYEQPLIDIAAQPDEAVVQSEHQQQMAELIRQLPDEQRQAVELRIMAGLSVREAATIMGKTEAALKMLQQRALKNLRKLCVEHGLIS